MGYQLFGRLHAVLAGQRGQGTVEYVGLILLLAVVLAGVVAAAGGLKGDDTIPNAIIEKLERAIEDVGAGK
jgi:hypothetical protein